MLIFEIGKRSVGDVLVFEVKGFFNGDAGKEINDIAQETLRNGNIHYVIDFSQCRVVNSLGVGALIDLSSKVLDQYKGKLVFSGLDKLKTEVFNIVGLLGMIPVVKTADEGCKYISKNV